MTSCFMFRDGQASITVRRSAAIGDMICASVVADKLSELGYAVVFQTHPMIAEIARRCPAITRVESPTGPTVAHVNLDGAYEDDPWKRRRHFHDLFLAAANLQLRRYQIDLGPPLNCKPALRVRDNEREATLAKFKPYARPWVFVCPRSDTYAVRQVPDGIWHEAAKKIEGTKFWIGRHPAPPEYVSLKGPLETILAWLSVADLLVTVDTAPLHMAAALGVPIVAVYQSSNPELHLSDQRDFTTISPPLDCLGCMENQCPKSKWMPPCQQVNPDMIAGAVNWRLHAYDDGKVSAVVPTYNAPDYRLNRVLENLLPQVDEIVVTRETGGAFPAGAMRHAKIRYVVKGASQIGFGRNVNFGVRHTRHSWLLLVNDDFYANLGMVAALLREAKPDTGMLSPLIRFPGGRIYVTCKVRPAGAKGWGHVDYRKAQSSFPNVTETEVACACCVLIRRKAFYQAGGFDEEFQFYSEDDDFSLGLRRGGWRILYVPAATGTHDEGQTTKLFPNRRQIMEESCRLVEAKWADYFQWNANRVPLGNFSYLKA